jgi:hypothetical protein
MDGEFPELPQIKRRKGTSLGGGSPVVACGHVPVARPFPDGRACKLCGCTDDSPDPVDEALQITSAILDGKIMFRLWGYKNKPDGKSDGYFCGFCVRVFNARYAMKQNPLTPGKCYTLSATVVLLGSSQQEHQRFHGFLKFMIEHMVKAGGRDKVGQLPWDQIDSLVLKMSESFEVTWSEKDDVWDLADYILAMGDPNTNGKGHTSTVNPNGKEVVLVPNKVGSLSRAFKRKTGLGRVVDSGKMHLSENHMNEKFQDMSRTIEGVRGSGQKMDQFSDMFAKFESKLGGAGGAKAITPGASSSSGEPGGPGVDDSESAGGLKFAFGFAPSIVSPAASPAAQPEVQAAIASGSTGRTKGRGRGAGRKVD